MADDVQALVELLCRADWTRLNLSANVSEHTDLSAYWAMRQSYAAAKPWYAQFVADRSPSGPATPAAESGAEPLPAQRSHLLIAAGGRFRIAGNHDGDMLVDGFDDETGWTEYADGEITDSVIRLGRPCDEMLCPAWLPSRFELAITGSAIVDGRRASQITGRPRPFARGRAGLMQTGGEVRSPRFRRRRQRADQLLDQVEASVDAELGILLRCERRYDGTTVSGGEIVRAPGE